MLNPNAMTAAQLAALLRPEAIRLDVQAREKVPALREIAALLAGNAAVPDVPILTGEILAREQESNTALGHGVALPHARTDHCRAIVIAVGRSAAGIDYRAPDGQPVKLVFLLGTPQAQVTEYLRVVGCLARLLGNDAIRQKLLAAPDARRFIAIIAGAKA